MSIITEITRLQNLRTAIRAKLITLGLVSSPSADLSACTTAIESISANGAVGANISTKTDIYTVPAGYHNGSGTVRIASTEQDKLIPANIRQGITLLGVEGNYASGGGTGSGFSGTPVAGDTPVLVSSATAKASTSLSLAETSVSISIPVAGTYRFHWSVYAPGVTAQSQLYRNGTAVGTMHYTTNVAETNTLDLTCAAGDVVAVWLKGGLYWGVPYGAVSGLTASISWDNGF